MSRLGKRLLTAGFTGVLLGGGAAAPAQAAPGAAPGRTAGPAATSELERKRVDSVPTPDLGWYSCYGGVECATTRLPLDYDEPQGATTEIALLRVKAKDQKRKIGSLFVNPGGPGGSGTDMAIAAPYFLSQSVIDRFDIVGFDPRGVMASDNVKCFGSVKQQTEILGRMGVGFPFGEKQERDYLEAAKELGKACSTSGRPLTGAMSTAEAARDMDVLRRAVGDEKLTYLAFSYGSALGQYYANMFPDRFRAIAVDGILDPEHWVGTPKTANAEQDERLGSAAGAYRALRELLKRCDKAGEKYCEFAAGDPVKRFDTIAQRLRKKPLTITDEFGEYTITYADFVNGILGALYGIDAGEAVASISQQLWTLIYPPSDTSLAKAARTDLIQRIKDARKKPARDFPYANGFEAFASVLCTDALHPKDADSWPALMNKADKRAPYFGRAWGWSSVQCARETWTVHDEDAYTGPWNVHTTAPILFVGARWDPATNYDDATSAARRAPNARLLTSTNWGHTSYGTSECVTRAVDTYLVQAQLPARGTTCEGEYQPYTVPLPTTGELPTQPTESTPTTTGLPPVAAQPPPSILNGSR